MSARAPSWLATTNARASNGIGPTDIHHRPSTSNFPDQMSSKKRPLQSSGRKSPPGKRVRPGEEDGYVHTGSPTVPFSPPQSRHNSIQGIDVSVPAGPAPKYRDGCRVDQSRPPTDNVDSLDAAASPPVQGEIGTPRSGDSTPQHVAPPAPSMVATTATPAAPTLYGDSGLHTLINMFNMANAEHYDTKIRENQKITGSPSGSVVSLRLLKQKKNAQARRELDHCKQNLGDSLADKLQAIMANCDGVKTTRPLESEQNIVKQLQGQNKALQIEIQQLKTDRDKILGRLDEMERSKAVRHDTDNLLKQMSSLQTVPQQLVKLEQLHAAVEQLKADVKCLEQVKPAALSLTAENVQSMIADHIRSKFEPKWTDMIQDINGLKSSPNTSTLLEFKKQVDKEDWSNQLNTLTKRMDTVDKIENVRQAVLAKRDENLAKQSKRLDELANNLSTSLKRLEGYERTTAYLSNKLGSNKQEHDVEIWKLKKLIGEPDSKPGQAAKPVLSKIKDLEQNSSESIQRLKSSEAALANFHTRLAAFTEAFEKSTLELQQLGALLGEEPRQAKKPVMGRILDLEATYGQFQTFHSTRDKLRNDIDRNTKMLEELFNKPSQHDPTVVPGASADDHEKEIVNLHGDFINEVNTKIAKLEERVATSLTDTGTISWQNKVALVDALKDELGSALRNIADMDQTLVKVEEEVHTLRNRMLANESKVISSVQARFDDLNLKIESWENRQQQQPQVMSQQILTPDERANLDLVPQISHTMSNTISPRLDDHFRQLNHMGHQIQVLDKVYQTLQERYDNISTDTVYQKMMKWFVESYGSAHDLANLVNWLNMNRQQLSQLAPIAQQIVNAMQEMPGIRQTLMETVITARETLAKVEQAATATAAHGNTIATLGKGTDVLDRSLSLERTRINEISASVKSLSNSINMDQIRETISTLESTLKAHGERITKIGTRVDSLEEFNEQNKQLVGLLPQLYLTIHQIQEVIRSINSNLPDGGFSFEFLLDFNKLDPRLTNPLGKEPSAPQTAA